MAEDWENLNYTKSWMKQPRKKPDWVSFGLKKNEQGFPDKMFEIALQPPICYPKGNSANRIPLSLDHRKYVTELNQTWLTYCNEGYEIDQNIKANGLNFELDRKIRTGQYVPTLDDKKTVQSKISQLSETWRNA